MKTNDQQTIVAVTVDDSITLVTFDSEHQAYAEVARFNEYVEQHSLITATAEVFTNGAFEEFTGNLTDWLPGTESDCQRLEDAGWYRAAGDWYKPDDEAQDDPHSLTDALNWLDTEGENDDED